MMNVGFGMACGALGHVERSTKLCSIHDGLVKSEGGNYFGKKLG